MPPAAIRIVQGVGDAPPPPLAGALAAWVARAGGAVHVVDPRGGPMSAGSPDLPLFVHLESGRIGATTVPSTSPPTFFGPGRHRDPELAIDPSADLRSLEVLPLTTFHGFGAQTGAFRLLAGRGDRVRPVGHLIREIVYLVEMARLGHVLFDDADLATHPGWLSAFKEALSHLPWRITWEGTVGGVKTRSASRLS